MNYMKNKSNFFLSMLCFLIMSITSQALYSQEALKSWEEEYYDFLALSGNSTRKYLNYRTLSDSDWDITDESGINPWEEKTIGTEFVLIDTGFESGNKYLNYFLQGLNPGLSIRAYGPEWYSSYNTANPFGINDGALWQGRGYNTSMTGGLRLEGLGFELTLKPQLSWSQNLEYEIMASQRGNGFGHYYYNCDAPQRFGDESFYTYDWGESEIRWSWKTFTLGFGTQSVWLGPNFLHPLLLSNNAATFPKFDMGLRRTSVVIPWANWDLGDIEVRFMVGRLTESDYFDDDETNDFTQYVLWSVSYMPSFFSGLTLGANKVCLSNWEDANGLDYLNPFYARNRWRQDVFGNMGEDQKASVTADWLFDQVGAEFYAEIGIDDYLPEGLDPYAYARFPFHTMSYTVGLQKSLTISAKKNLYGKINFEWNNTEPSQDYQMWGSYNFGTHYQIIQGYTNRGQWLGSGIGYGGNSQYLAFTLYSNHGFDKFFIARNNPDNSYIWGMCPNTDKTTMAARYFTAYKANFYTGFESMWFIWKGLSLSAGFTYNLIINPLYNPGNSGQFLLFGQVVDCYREHEFLNNFSFKCSVKYSL